MDTATPGQYVVYYSCTDSQGYGSEANRAVIVEAPPAENLRPMVSVSPQAIYLSVGQSYSLPSATCTDSEDGDLTATIEVDGADEVDNETVGTYEVFYMCTDSGGLLSATSVTIYVDQR